MSQGFQFTHIKIDLLSGHDATSSSAPIQAVCNNYVWNITVCFTGLVGGPPEIKVKVSNDGVKFDQYNSCAVNSSGDTISFYDDILAFPFIQLEYEPNGASAGTVDASLILKPTK